MGQAHDFFSLLPGERQRPRGKLMNTFFFQERLKFSKKFAIFLCKEVFFGEDLSVVSLVFGLDLKQACPWPQEGLSSEGRSLILVSIFFVFLALALSLISSTSPLSVTFKKAIKLYYSTTNTQF